MLFYYLDLIRIRRSLLLTLLSLAAYVTITEQVIYSQQMGWLAIAVLTSFFATHTLNNILDIELDKLYRPQRALPSGRVSKLAAFVVFIDAVILCSVISLFFFPFALLLIAINLIATYLYPHVRNKLPIIGFVKGYYAMSAIIFAAAAAGSFNLLSLALAVLTFLSILALETTRDICDFHGEKYRKTSFATSFGDKVAGAIAAYLLLGVIFFSLLPSVYYGRAYLFVAGVADTILAYPAFRLLFEPTAHAKESSRFIIGGLAVLVLAFVVGVLSQGL